LTPSRQPRLSGSASRDSLVREWAFRFALNAGQTPSPEQAGSLLALWIEGFADVPEGQLQAAFLACLRSHTFKTIPTIGDIRQHLQRAIGNAAEEEAAMKWERVLNYAIQTSPDIPDRNPPPIKPRTRCAIRAAGGLEYIRDCDKESLQWARKRFIEAYVRWGELQQDEYLLPPGEVRQLLEEFASTKSVEYLLSVPKASDTQAHTQNPTE